MDEELSRYVIRELEGLEDGERRGSGSFGSVYQVRINGMPCIAKRLHDILADRRVAVAGAASGGGAAIKERFRTECLLLSRIRHPNIVQFLGVHYGPASGDLTLVLEHLHMDLQQCLQTYPLMPLSIRLDILKDVSYGLLHLHTRDPPIVHRDITASNVLLTPDMRAKITDLGVSRLLDFNPQQLSKFTACPGTLAYMPPEALRPEPTYDVSLDNFSFGVVALFAANQEFPEVYHGLSVPDSVQQEGKSQIFKRKKAMDKLSANHCLHPLIVQCLSDEADKRPTSAEINSKMKELCERLPKRFTSVLEMHREIWKLHGEREKLAQQLSAETESKEHGLPGLGDGSELQRDDLIQQILTLRRENQTFRQENQRLQTELSDTKEREKELELEIRNARTPQQQNQTDYYDEEVCPLPGPSITNSSKREHTYVNHTPSKSTNRSSNPVDDSTPVNAPHLLPGTASYRVVDLHAASMVEQPRRQDFQTFAGNGRFSGPSSNFSSGSTGSQTLSGPFSPSLDPNLVCPGCRVQFREGEIQEFRKHTDTCDKAKSLRQQYTSSTNEAGYREDFNTAMQKFDPNLTCIGCSKGFKEAQIQQYREHCRSCSKYVERLRSPSEGAIKGIVRRDEAGEGEESRMSFSQSLPKGGHGFS